MRYGDHAFNRGIEQLAARQAHNLEVGGSSPSPATYIHISEDHSVNAVVFWLCVDLSASERDHGATFDLLTRRRPGDGTGAAHVLESAEAVVQIVGELVVRDRDVGRGPFLNSARLVGGRRIVRVCALLIEHTARPKPVGPLLDRAPLHGPRPVAPLG